MAGDSNIVLNPGVGGASTATYQDASGYQHQKVVLETQTGSNDPAKVNLTNPMPIGAVYNSAAPTVTNGALTPLQTDVNGNIKVNIAAGAAAGGTSSNFASAFPGIGTAIGLSNGTNMVAALADGSGNLKVNIAAGGVPAGQDNTAFTAGTTQGLPVDFVYNDGISAVTSGSMGTPRITSNRQVRVVVDAASNGGASYYSAVQPATPAKTVIKASAGQIAFICATNIDATPVYIKLFNVASGSVTLGTTAADVNLCVPASTTGAGFVLPIPAGLSFSTAITMAVTGGIAATDNTAITASKTLVTIGYA